MTSAASRCTPASTPGSAAPTGCTSALERHAQRQRLDRLRAPELARARDQPRSPRLVRALLQRTLPLSERLGAPPAALAAARAVRRHRLPHELPVAPALGSSHGPAPAGA